MGKVIVFSDNGKRNIKICNMMKEIIDEKRIVGFTNSIEMLDFIITERNLLGVFVDVDTADCNDLRLIRIMHNMKSNIPLVFISKQSKYAVEAFEYGVIDYLKLPFDAQKITNALEKLNKKKLKSRIEGVYIKTFGSFELFFDGKLVPWKNSKPKELLAFLVDCRGDNVSSDKIQNTLWPEVDSIKAAATYHTTLYQLRKKLEASGIEDLLIGSRGSHRVNIEAFECDLYLFEGEIESNELESYKAAFELYKGGYLENNAYKWSRFTRVRTEFQFEGILHKM